MFSLVYLELSTSSVDVASSDASRVQLEKGLDGAVESVFGRYFKWKSVLDDFVEVTITELRRDSLSIRVSRRWLDGNLRRCLSLCRTYLVSY